MAAPSHTTAIRCLRLEVDCLRQAVRCSRDGEERDRLAVRLADLEHSIAALEKAAKTEGGSC